MGMCARGALSALWVTGRWRQRLHLRVPGDCGGGVSGMNWLDIVVATLKMVLVLLVIEVKTSVAVIEGQWP